MSYKDTKYGKLNILIVHNYYQIPGGEDTVVANERKLLEEHGHKVITYSRSNSEIEAMSILKKIMLPFITIFNPKTYKDIKRVIKNEDIDIIHVHNTLTLISPSVYYAALRCKKSVVQTVHNFRLLCPGATFYRVGHICEDCVKYGLGKAIKYKCYRNSKAQTLVCVIGTVIHRMFGIYSKINYICLTEFTKNKLKKILPNGHIYIKPNVVFDKGIRKKVSDYYIFVGRIEEIKGINLLVDAFKRMPDKKLYVIGNGVLFDEVKKRLNKENIINIILLGYKEHEEVNEYIRSAKALIMCSQWYETFGMVIAEAYSNGTPAIVGDIGNIRGMVSRGVTGELFKYDSVDALVEAVEHFEYVCEEKYSESAYQFYKENFAPEANYHKLVSIYNAVKDNKVHNKNGGS